MVAIGAVDAGKAVGQDAALQVLAVGGLDMKGDVVVGGEVGLGGELKGRVRWISRSGSVFVFLWECAASDCSPKTLFDY